MSNLPYGSWRLWIPCVCTIVVIMWVLAHLYYDWKIFIRHRIDYLRNGSILTRGEDTETYDFTHTCIVELVPKSHQSETILYHYFNNLYPGKIRRVSLLLNTQKLSDLISLRKKFIRQYEDTFAKKKYLSNNDGLYKLFHKKYIPGAQVDRRLLEINKKIKKLTRKINMDYDELMSIKNKSEERAKAILEQDDGKLEIVAKKEDTGIENFSLLVKAVADIVEVYQRGAIFITNIKNALTMKKLNTDAITNTAFIEFKDLKSKQIAIQCNLNVTLDSMKVSSAPKKEDLIWSNMRLHSKAIDNRRGVAEIIAMIYIGACFFAFGYMGFFVYQLKDFDIIKSIVVCIGAVLVDVYFLISNFLMLELGLCYVKEKTKSEIDRFVFRWNVFHRIIALISFNVGILQEDYRIYQNWFQASSTHLFPCLENFLQRIVFSINKTSAIFIMQYILLQIGVTLMRELAQCQKILKHFYHMHIIPYDSLSTRCVKILNTESSFIFCQSVPKFMLVFALSILYGITTPIVSLVCALYFCIAKRVYMHQALIIKVQKYDTGGILMYSASRYTFFTLYVVTFLLAIIFLMEGGRPQAAIIILFMYPIYLVQMFIYHHFVEPSKTLSIERSRKTDNICRYQKIDNCNESQSYENWSYYQPSLGIDRLDTKKML